MIKWTQVQSKAMIAVRYLEEKKTLQVRFNTTSAGEYYPVTMTQFTLFMNAESKGSWLSENIKKNPKIMYSKIETRTLFGMDVEANLNWHKTELDGASTPSNFRALTEKDKERKEKLLSQIQTPGGRETIKELLKQSSRLGK